MDNHMKLNDVVNFVSSYATKSLSAAHSFLLTPKVFFRERKKHFEANADDAVRDTLVFAAVFVFIGSSIATFFGIGGEDTIISYTTIVSALFIWVLFAAFCHLTVMIIRGRGSFRLTLIVTILTLSITQVIWMPVIGFLSKNSTNTQVTITYEYVISFGYGNWRDVYLNPFFGNILVGPN